MMSKKMGGIRHQQVFIVVYYPNLQYFVILVTHEQHFWYFFWFGRRLSKLKTSLLEFFFRRVKKIRTVHTDAGFRWFTSFLNWVQHRCATRMSFFYFYLGGPPPHQNVFWCRMPLRHGPTLKHAKNRSLEMKRWKLVDNSISKCCAECGEWGRCIVCCVTIPTRWLEMGGLEAFLGWSCPWTKEK